MVVRTCTWCGTFIRDPKKGRDHVFPRALGGTFEADLWVPSCRDCQTRISQAEGEIARRSPFGVYRFAKGVKPRHKKRGTSGLVEPRVMMVKSASWQRYVTQGLRCGESYPRTLPAIEINLETGNLFYHGSSAEDVGTLLDVLACDLGREPDGTGVVFEVSTRLVDELLPEASADPDFNPRLYLSPKGHLEVCARDPEEAKNALRTIFFHAKEGRLPPPDPERWGKAIIPRGLPSHFSFRYRVEMLDRVLLKIAHGVVCAWLRREDREGVPICAVQRAVLGKSDTSFFTISKLDCDEELGRKLEDYHAVLVCRGSGRAKALICLYGSWYTLHLAYTTEIAELPEFIGACCHVTATAPKAKQRWLTAAQVQTLFHRYGEGLR